MNEAEEASSVLRAFFQAMNAWEKESKLLYKRAEKGEFDGEEWGRRIATSLEALYREFCESGAAPARLQRGNLRYCSPPEYNADAEKILSVEVDGNVATITTLPTHDPRQFKKIYQLVKSPPGWRLRDNRREIKKDGRIVPWDL